MTSRIPQFGNHDAETGATRRIAGCAQQRDRIACASQEQFCGIAAKFGKTRGIETAAAFLGGIGAQPQNRLARAFGAQRQHRAKAGRTSGIDRIGGANLMQPRPCQPAPQHPVQSGMAGSESIEVAAAQCGGDPELPGHGRIEATR